LNLGPHGFASIADATIGAAAGYLCLGSVAWVFHRLTGKEGMGQGDWKLLAALGAWFGWTALPGVILLASLAGVGVSWCGSWPAVPPVSRPSLSGHIWRRQASSRCSARALSEYHCPAPSHVKGME